MLAFAREVGLQNWITLQSTTLPGWYLDDEGGHRDEDARGRYWLRHVDRVAEAFDEFATGFVPIDDPIGWAVRSYGLGSRPPGRKDRVVLREAVEGAVHATHEAIRLLSSGRQQLMTAWRADPIHALAEDDGRVSLEATQAAAAGKASSGRGCGFTPTACSNSTAGHRSTCRCSSTRSITSGSSTTTRSVSVPTVASPWPQGARASEVVLPPNPPSSPRPFTV